MKMSMIAAGFAVLVATPGWDAPGYWVIKDVRVETCDIVTTNPVIDGPLGPILWGSGPYKSQQDAELARRTIPSCNAI